MVESSVLDHKHHSIFKTKLLTFDVPELNVPITSSKLHLLNSLERTHEVLTKTLIFLNIIDFFFLLDSPSI